MFKNFQNCFLHAGIFLALYKKYQIFMSFKILWKIILTYFRANSGWAPHGHLPYDCWSSTAKGEHQRTHQGVGRTQVAVVRAPLAPKVTWPLWSGSLHVPSLVFLLIEAERGVLSSHAHSLHSHSLSHILARIFIRFWLKFDCKKTLSLISLL